jgi:hypothetical protein
MFLLTLMALIAIYPIYTSSRPKECNFFIRAEEAPNLALLRGKGVVGGWGGIDERIIKIVDLPSPLHFSLVAIYSFRKLLFSSGVFHFFLDLSTFHPAASNLSFP